MSRAVVQTSRPSPATVRAFFAVELGDSARAAAARAAAELRARDERGAVRFTRPESLHVTLRFLGDVATDRIEGLVGCVAREAAAVAPFDLTLGAVEAFPARRPHVLALAVAPAEPLARAAEAVERGCVAAGFPAEARPFRGHLTLGRVKRGRPGAQGARVPRYDDVAVSDHEPTPVRDAVLFASELRPEGARHTPLERVALGPVSEISEPR